MARQSAYADAIGGPATKLFSWSRSNTAIARAREIEGIDGTVKWFILLFDIRVFRSGCGEPVNVAATTAKCPH